MVKRETSVSKANEKAAALKQKGDLERALLQECYDLESGKQSCIQQIMAYVRRLKNLK